MNITEHELYNTWAGMVQRCTNPRHTRYASYGGRGITMCERWRSSVHCITDLEELLGPRPPGHTLDRIDNDGNYEPGNVRWATDSEQQFNCRPRNNRSNKYGMKYVCFKPRCTNRPYQGQFRWKGKQYRTKHFATIQEAHDAAVELRRSIGIVS